MESEKDLLLAEQLRTIRPFTEDQLLNFYQNSQLADNQEFIARFVEVCGRNLTPM